MLLRTRAIVEGAEIAALAALRIDFP